MLSPKLRVYAVPALGIPAWACGYRICESRGDACRKCVVIWQRQHSVSCRIYYDVFLRANEMRHYSIDVYSRLRKFRVGAHSSVSKLANKYLPDLMEMEYLNKKELCSLFMMVKGMIAIGVSRKFFTVRMNGAVQVRGISNGHLSALLTKEDLQLCNKN